ncbi:DoxX family protein [Myroides odoratus]|uniref:DoxX n=1 Tax=Myroides odoratus TaxID=256 RepID=A0A378RNP8_MYROD|nr:DoxX family protein [Myroides odoratus]MCS4237791.1 putative oxidoreductase [Myroides odoratus]MDH6599855.1 putative oxidoreductase [Myroides gitamensis]QQU04584.1 DoxX family protein [Myroides odoratus]STZ27979.1 DoxX [Myroides odoratus]
MQDLGKFILRLGVGGLMIFHGIHKIIHGHDMIIEQLAAKGYPTWLWLGVPVGEIIAPILLIVGVFTRLSGVLIAFTMVMSMVLVKGGGSFALSAATGGIGAELNVLYLVGALAIAMIGPGSYRLYKGKKGWFI